MNRTILKDSLKDSLNPSLTFLLKSIVLIGLVLMIAGCTRATRSASDSDADTGSVDEIVYVPTVQEENALRRLSEVMAVNQLGASTVSHWTENAGAYSRSFDRTIDGIRYSGDETIRYFDAAGIPIVNSDTLNPSDLVTGNVSHRFDLEVRMQAGNFDWGLVSSTNVRHSDPLSTIVVFETDVMEEITVTSNVLSSEDDVLHLRTERNIMQNTRNTITGAESHHHVVEIELEFDYQGEFYFGTFETSFQSARFTLGVQLGDVSADIIHDGNKVGEIVWNFKTRQVRALSVDGTPL